MDDTPKPDDTVAVINQCLVSLANNNPNGPSHKTSTRERWYAIEPMFGPRFDKFTWASSVYHELIGLGPGKQDPPPSTSALITNYSKVQKSRLTAQSLVLDDDIWIKQWLHQANTGLRDHQRRVLEAMAAGKTDIVYITSTSGGKSVAYQVPAMVDSVWPDRRYPAC